MESRHSPSSKAHSFEGDLERKNTTASCRDGISKDVVEHEAGHLKRDISGLNMVALAFNVCNSWTAVATTLAIAISAGGTFTVLYGMMIVSVVYVAVALPLAELASVYPTAGGQYHFASILAPKRFSRGISYACGVAATCSWVFLAAGVTTLASQLILALPAYYIQGYDPKIWHYFLIFQAINIFVLAYNIFLLKKAPWTHEIGCKELLPKVNAYADRNLLSHTHPPHLCYRLNHMSGLLDQTAVVIRLGKLLQ
jgi:choline transport protein